MNTLADTCIVCRGALRLTEAHCVNIADEIDGPVFQYLACPACRRVAATIIYAVEPVKLPPAGTTEGGSK